MRCVCAQVRPQPRSVVPNVVNFYHTTGHDASHPTLRYPACLITHYLNKLVEELASSASSSSDCEAASGASTSLLRLLPCVDARFFAFGRGPEPRLADITDWAFLNTRFL